MKFFMNFLSAVIGLLNVFKSAPATDVSDKNVKTVKVGLDLADESDPEVANAKHRLNQIEKLPENERIKRATELKEMESLVEKKSKALKPTDKKSVMEQLRESQGRKGQ